MFTHPCKLSCGIIKHPAVFITPVILSEAKNPPHFLLCVARMFTSGNNSAAAE